MNPDATLFVSIASYRDSELLPTLQNMISEAQHPQRLRIAICWQDDNDIKVFLDQGMHLNESRRHHDCMLYCFHWQGVQIQVLAVHYFESLGACWARHMAETLFKQEDYFLQIDSHCRFIQHWDSAMISMLEKLRPQSARPILSSYPPAYTPGENETRTKIVSRLVFNLFNKDGIVSLTSRSFEEAAPRRCGFLAAGFVFCDGHFVENVPNDPQIFFMGEEISMAARAYTHGYDAWSPNSILLWHFYARKEHPKVWGDHTNEAKKEGKVDQAWWERDKVSKQRVLSVLRATNEPCELGRYQLGTQRSLQEYEHRIGLSFRHKITHPDVCGPEKVNFFHKLPANHQQWLQSLQHVYVQKVRLSKEEADFSRNDVRWWHVGIYNAQNTPLMIQKLTLDAVKKLLTRIDDTASDLQVQFITHTALMIHTIRICPYVEDEGWGKVVEKPW